MIAAMDVINLELATHFGHLTKPGLMGFQQDAIDGCASRGVARGFALIALHQTMLSLQLDELEEQPLAVQN